MQWRGNFYFDTVLPFGLRSAPSLFNHLAEALQSVLVNNYAVPALERYLNDFISPSPASSSVHSSTAAVHKATILQVFDNLKVPVADGADKIIGPATCITVLGAELDSVAGELCLLSDKLEALQTLLQSWSQHHSVSKHELQSLVGHLSFAAKVVPARHTFTRQLIDLCSSAAESSALLHLTNDARADIIMVARVSPAVEQ